MLELLRDHQTRQSTKVETCATHKHTMARQPDPRSPRRLSQDFLEDVGQFLTLVGAEQADSCSCRAEARERPASPPARHASPPRSPSTRGDLEKQHTCQCPHTAPSPRPPYPRSTRHWEGKRRTNIVVEELKTFFTNFLDLLLRRLAVTLVIFSFAF